MAQFNQAEFNRRMREAQRKAQAAVQQEVNRVNLENQRRVDAFNREQKRQVDAYNREQQRRVDAANRQAQQHNARVVSQHNAEVQRVNQHNRQVDATNRRTIAELNRQLRSSGPVRYTEAEQGLADRLQAAIVAADEKDYDVFLSYARIDGSETAEDLKDALESFGVRVWFDAVAIQPGKSQALQMDKGLRKARCGIALLTPAYLTGRFWTERELGALLHKETLIPVLHNVTFGEVAEYSGILPDLAGFETSRDSIEDIAEKITAAILEDEVTS